MKTSQQSYLELLGFTATANPLVEGGLSFEKDNLILISKNSWIDLFERTNKQMPIPNMKLLSTFHADNINDLQFISICYAMGLISLKEFISDYNKVKTMLNDFDKNREAQRKHKEWFVANKLNEKQSNARAISFKEAEDLTGVNIMQLATAYYRTNPETAKRN